MSEEKIYPVPKEFAAKTHITDKQYQKMYQQSVSDPEGFWGEQAEQFIDWSQSWDKVMDCDFSGDVNIAIAWRLYCTTTNKTGWLMDGD